MLREYCIYVCISQTHAKRVSATGKAADAQHSIRRKPKRTPPTLCEHAQAYFFVCLRQTCFALGTNRGRTIRAVLCVPAVRENCAKHFCYAVCCVRARSPDKLDRFTRRACIEMGMYAHTNIHTHMYIYIYICKYTL